MLVDVLRITKDSPLMQSVAVTPAPPAALDPRRTCAAKQYQLSTCSAALEAAAARLQASVDHVAPQLRALQPLQRTWVLRKAGQAVVVDCSMSACGDAFEASLAQAVVAMPESGARCVCVIVT